MTRALLVAAEAGAREWATASGSATSVRSGRCVRRCQWFPRVNEIIKLLGSHNLLATPSEAAFDNPELRPVGQVPAGREPVRRQERVRLFRAAWDFAGTALGGRNELYERFYLGSAARSISSTMTSHSSRCPSRWSIPCRESPRPPKKRRKQAPAFLQRATMSARSRQDQAHTRWGRSAGIGSPMYLAAYAKGPAAYASSPPALVPTDDYTVMYESRASRATRPVPATPSEQHAPNAPRWTVSTRGPSSSASAPPAGSPDDFSTSLYRQAAGTADTMTIEFSASPAEPIIDAVSVHVGCWPPAHRTRRPRPRDRLPHSIQMIGRHEVFTARRPRTCSSGSRTDTIGDGYLLRPVEGYTAIDCQLANGERARRAH